MCSELKISKELKNYWRETIGDLRKILPEINSLKHSAYSVLPSNESCLC
jgi:hypothetical protein